MTEKPDYTKMNPLVLAGHRAIAEHSGPRVPIFNEDGTPTMWQAPTHEQEGAFLDAITKLGVDMDMRTLLYLIQQTNSTLTGSLYQSMNVAHMIAHSEEARAKGYDEETLCKGVGAYLDPDRDHDQTPHQEIDVDTMLDKFFIKPDAKPN